MSPLREAAENQSCLVSRLPTVTCKFPLFPLILLSRFLELLSRFRLLVHSLWPDNKKKISIMKKILVGKGLDFIVGIVVVLPYKI